VRELVDDSSVSDDDVVYRRADWDKIGGRTRTAPGQTAKISPNFFTDYPKEAAELHGYPDPCMSVGLHSMIQRLGYGPEVMLEEFPDYGLLMVHVGDLRQLMRGSGAPCAQGVLASPTEDEPWHGVVFDLESRPRRDPAKKAIAKVACWVIPLIG